MGLGDALKGLFRRADTGAAGEQPVADAPTAEGATSVPTNLEGTPPAEGVEMNMGNPSVGEAGPASVAPDLGPESPAVSEPATGLNVPVTESEGAVPQEASVIKDASEEGVSPKPEVPTASSSPSKTEAE